MVEGTAMKTECYPISLLPGLSRLFLDFAERRDALTPFFPASAYSTEWMTIRPVLSPAGRETLCNLLEEQNRSFGAADAVFENIARLRTRCAERAVRRIQSSSSGSLATPGPGTISAPR